MEKNGKILLSRHEYDEFISSGRVPNRVVEDWGIADPVELRNHIASGFCIVHNNENQGDS